MEDACVKATTAKPGADYLVELMILQDVLFGDAIREEGLVASRLRELGHDQLGKSGGLVQAQLRPAASHVAVQMAPVKLASRGLLAQAKLHQHLVHTHTHSHTHTPLCIIHAAAVCTRMCYSAVLA